MLKNVHYKISGLEEIKAVCKDKTRKAVSAPAFPSLTIMCAWPPELDTQAVLAGEVHRPSCMSGCLLEDGMRL